MDRDFRGWLRLGLRELMDGLLRAKEKLCFGASPLNAIIDGSMHVSRSFPMAVAADAHLL